MQRSLKNLINEFGPPDVLIDHWDDNRKGCAIWGFDETILWDSSGLYLSGKKNNEENLNVVQKILDDWKKKSNQIAAVGFISYNFKNILYPHLSFNNNDKKFPYLFFGKPQKIKKYDVRSENIRVKTSIDLYSDILNKNQYKKKISSIKDELEEGNAYQINFTMPKKYKTKNNAFDIYCQLRNHSKPKFGYYFKAENFEILSFSPECFFKRKNNKIFSYPMKGTRPRSKEKKHDIQLKGDLKKSIKDKAEHLMIVDLIRNDLGKISKYGSVKVKEMYKIESYETVHQMISCVYGTLQSNIKEFHIINALFPGGSITGAPKESAMKIIDKLENYSRNIYTGSIGFVKSNGDMNFNMPIRTMTIKNNEAIYPVGGGIVWDSDYKEEWDEAQIKSKILSYIET